jgi:hypothetical protein
LIVGVAGERAEEVLVATTGDGVAEDFTSSGFGSGVSTETVDFAEAAGAAVVESFGDAGVGACWESGAGTGSVPAPGGRTAFDADGSEEEATGVTLIGGALETAAAASAMAAVSAASEESADCGEEVVEKSESAASLKLTEIAKAIRQRTSLAFFWIGSDFIVNRK